MPLRVRNPELLHNSEQYESMRVQYKSMLSDLHSKTRLYVCMLSGTHIQRMCIKFTTRGKQPILSTGDQHYIP
jgi:hypothetical protein